MSSHDSDDGMTTALRKVRVRSSSRRLRCLALANLFPQYPSNDDAGSHDRPSDKIIGAIVN
jgi:hypothetical protein